MDDPNKLDELFNNYITQRLRGGLHIAYGMLYVQISLVFPYLFYLTLYFFYLTLILGIIAYYIYLCEECGYMVDHYTFEMIRINSNPDPIFTPMPAPEFFDHATIVDKYTM